MLNMLSLLLENKLLRSLLCPGATTIVGTSLPVQSHNSHLITPTQCLVKIHTNNFVFIFYLNKFKKKITEKPNMW